MNPEAKERKLTRVMTPAAAKRLLTIRKEIENIADRVYYIGDLMSMLEHAEGVSINHMTCAWIGKSIADDALEIFSLLDDLICG